MKLRNLLSGVSLGVLAFAAFETPARAQEQLPDDRRGRGAARCWGARRGARKRIRE